MDEGSESKSLAGLISALISKSIADLANREAALSVADIVRLLELQKQLASEEVREVKVTWVEFNPAPSVTRK